MIFADTNQASSSEIGRWLVVAGACAASLFAIIKLLEWFIKKAKGGNGNNNLKQRVTTLEAEQARMRSDIAHERSERQAMRIEMTVANEERSNKIATRIDGIIDNLSRRK